ncbi:MAG: hypothetical protein IBX47_09570 [Desulfuromonadales bacterium]|nr:hypothetical protein [Desulfuromonadales bacterium]
MAIPLLAPSIAVLISFLSSSLAKLLVDRLLFFLAFKALVLTAFVIVVPLVVNNILHDLLEMTMSKLNEATYNSGLNGAMQFSEFMGWLVYCFKIPECLAVIISGLQMRLTLRLIPFSPFK